MNLHDTIVQRFFPDGFQDTMLRLKNTEKMALNGKYGRGYFFEDYSDDWIQKHCAGTETLSAAAINSNRQSCWMAIDIDCYPTETDRAAANLQAAMQLFENCPYEKLLETSNNYGGYHLWIFPPTVMSGADAVAWIKQFIGDNKFEVRPTIDSPARALPCYFSNSLRLPGFSPKRGGTWSTIWNGTEWIDVRQMT